MDTTSTYGLSAPYRSSPVAEALSPVTRLRYGLVFVGQLLLWALIYLAINRATEGVSALQPLLPYEERIPRVSAAYPVYALVYFQVFLPLFLARSRSRYFDIQSAFVLASLTGFAIFWLAPMTYPRPPLQIESLFDLLLSLEYSGDGAACTFPSLHVAFTWIVYLGLRDRSSTWRAILLATAVGISISTVLVKQHFLVDVPAGMALAFVCWIAAPIATRLFVRRG